MKLRLLAELISCFCEVLMLVASIKFILSRKENPSYRTCLRIYCIYFIVLFIAMRISFIYKMCMVLVTFILCNRLIIKETWEMAVVKAAGAYILIAITIGLAHVITSYILNTPIDFYDINIKNRTCTYITGFIITILWCNLRKIFNLLRDGAIKLQKYCRVIAIIVLTVLMIINYELLLKSKIFYEIRKESAAILIISVAVLFLIIGGIVLSYVESMKQRSYIEKKEMEFQQLKNYSEIYEEMAIEFKRHKHDFMNLIIPIRGYLEDKKYDELEEYFFKEILSEENHMDGSYNKYINLGFIKNSGIKGIIISKITEASNQGIQVYLHANEYVFTQRSKTKIICEILGSIIDNAIEEAQQSNEKRMEITLSREKNEVEIVVGNTYKDRPKLNKIFNKGYSTKGKNRGMGLFIVKEILKNEEEIFLNTVIHEEMFIQELKIYGGLDESRGII